jgi:hypothetical protein
MLVSSVKGICERGGAFGAGVGSRLQRPRPMLQEIRPREPSGLMRGGRAGRSTLEWSGVRVRSEKEDCESNETPLLDPGHPMLLPNEAVCQAKATESAVFDAKEDEGINRAILDRPRPLTGVRRFTCTDDHQPQEVRVPDPPYWSAAWQEMMNHAGVGKLQRAALAALGRRDFLGPEDLATILGELAAHSLDDARDVEPLLNKTSVYPLPQLKILAAKLTIIAGLKEADALAYLLCNRTPPRLGAHVFACNGPNGTLGAVTFVLTVRDPQLVSRERLGEFYAELREQVVGACVFDRPWPARMVAFVEEQRFAGATWTETHALWNQQYPDHPWKNWRSMQSSYRWETRDTRVRAAAASVNHGPTG